MWWTSVLHVAQRQRSRHRQGRYLNEASPVGRALSNTDELKSQGRSARTGTSDSAKQRMMVFESRKKPGHHIQPVGRSNRRKKPRRAPNASTILSVPPLMQRLRVPKTLPLLPLQMTIQRVASAERSPAPSDHHHPVELEHLRLPHGRGRHAELDRVHHGYPAAHPVRDVRAARMRLDVSLEIGRAAVAHGQ